MSRFSLWLCGIGAGLYAIIFIACTYLHYMLGAAIYDRYILEVTSPALICAGCFLFPGVILAEIIYQVRGAALGEGTRG